MPPEQNKQVDEDALAPLATVIPPEPEITPESVPVPLGGVTTIAPPVPSTNDADDVNPFVVISVPPVNTVPLVKLLAKTTVPAEPGGGTTMLEPPPVLGLAARNWNDKTY
jgi:hypothetical protein